MAQSASIPAIEAARAGEGAAEATERVPWYIWGGVVAVTSAVVGAHWDISWHQSIGRDTFWTPAHIAIYLCGVLAGICSAYLILSTTWGGSRAAWEASVKIWGFRGPLGAFICAWGGIAMLVSAPYDDWWHNAYGLDVKILSPPHLVLGLGLGAVRLGFLILILGCMNRARDEARRKWVWLFLYVGALFVVGVLILIMEHSARSLMHTARFYLLVATAVPFVLATIGRASGFRWASTVLAGVYTALLMLLVWILPLFSAEPKLGPVYQQVTRFIPPEFPLLILAPAVALDWLWPRLGGWNKWLQSAVTGPVFVASFLAVQWPFASFLMLPLARNWFFGAHYFGYFIEPSSAYAQHQFLPAEPPGEFWTVMAWALGGAIVTTRLGLGLGEWMRRIRR